MTVPGSRFVAAGVGALLCLALWWGWAESGGELQTGKVKWFNAEKGFGFITPDNGDTDVFVHDSDIRGQGRRILEEGQAVEYELSDDPKWPRALKVRPRTSPTGPPPG